MPNEKTVKEKVNVGRTDNVTDSFTGLLTVFYSLLLDFSPAGLHGSPRRGHSSQDAPRGPQRLFWLQSRAVEQPHPGLEDPRPCTIKPYRLNSPERRASPGSRLTLWMQMFPQPSHRSVPSVLSFGTKEMEIFNTSARVPCIRQQQPMDRVW